MQRELIQFTPDVQIRLVTNEDKDSSQAPLLKSLLGDEKYAGLLKLDPQPLVLDILAIATTMNGPLSFKPKYDIEITREMWDSAAEGWLGKPYTNKHSPEWDDTDYPMTLGRILKQELRADGWHVYAYVMPSQEGYRKDVRVEADLFQGKMVRQVSSEFFIQRMDDTITTIDPVLIAEVFRPNVKGSGVAGVYNSKSLEVGMGAERVDVINSLKPEELKETNVLRLLHNQFNEALPERLKNEAPLRLAVITSLTEKEKTDIVNSFTKEFVEGAEKLLATAQVIINERAESAKKAMDTFVSDIRLMLKNDKVEVEEETVRAFIMQNEFRPGDEAKVKKTIAHYKLLNDNLADVFAKLVTNQPAGQTTTKEGEEHAGLANGTPPTAKPSKFSATADLLRPQVRQK